MVTGGTFESTSFKPRDKRSDFPSSSFFFFHVSVIGLLSLHAEKGSGQERHQHVDPHGGVSRGRNSPGSIVGGCRATAAGPSKPSVKGKTSPGRERAKVGIPANPLNAYSHTAYFLHQL